MTPARPNRSRRRIVGRALGALALGVAAAAFAAEVGLPPIRVVDPAPGEASFQSFALATDPRGLLYLGNLSGLFVYDGARWRRRELPSPGSLQALAVAENGELAVGALDEIGVFRRDADGATRYRSFTALVPEADRPLEDILAIHRAPAGWIFVSARAAWLSSAGAPPTGDRVEAIARWESGEELPRSFAAGGRRYLWLDSGLHLLDERGLRPLAGGERFRGRPVAAVARFGGRELAFVGDDGLADIDGAPLAASLAPLAAWARTHEVTTAFELRDGRLVLGSRRGGLALVAADGTLERQLDARGGLPDDHARALAMDAEGGLWVAFNSGLARVDLVSDLTLFTSRLGAPHSVLSFARHRGELWVGASSGLFRLRSDPASGESLLVPTRFGDRAVFALQEIDGRLWVGARDGLWISEDGTFRRLDGSAGETVYAIVPSPSQAGRVWLGLRRGLGGARRSAGAWRFEPPIPGSPRFVRSIVERAPARLWLGTALSGFARADRDATGAGERWSFALFDGGEVTLHEVDGEIVSILDRLHRLDEERSALVPDHPASGALAVERGFLVHLDPVGRLWVNGAALHRFDRQSDGTFSGAPRTIVGTEGQDIQALFGEPDGVLWIAMDRGVARYQERTAGAQSRPPRAMLSSVSIDGRTVVAETDGPLAGPLTLPERGSRIRVELAPGSFAAGVRYETRLDPVESDWSSPRDEPLVELAGLPAGDYRLDVRARDAAGAAGEISTLGFEILPAWYRTRGAYAALLLVAAAAIALAVRIRTRALRRRARWLENEVGAKTGELSTTIANLRTAREDLEQKNELLAEANRRLERWSLEDELTGLANRRALDVRLEDELARARRSGSPLALVLLDLDRFKEINDTFGHEAGDRCLERVSERVRSELRRRTDLAARYGGEEILLLLPDTTLDGAVAIAESLRAGIAALALGTAAGGAALTASFGVALATGAAGETTRELLRRADAALYRAKSEGRNRVVVADAPSG